MKNIVAYIITSTVIICSCNSKNSTGQTEQQSPTISTPEVIINYDSIAQFNDEAVIINEYEVMKENIGNMTFEDAKKAQELLGSGWRLPTKSEFNILIKFNRKNIKFENGEYWCMQEGSRNIFTIGKITKDSDDFIDNIQTIENPESEIRFVRFIRPISDLKFQVQAKGISNFPYNDLKYKVTPTEYYTEAFRVDRKDLDGSFNYDEGKVECIRLGKRLPTYQELAYVFNKRQLFGEFWSAYDDLSYYWTSTPDDYPNRDNIIAIWFYSDRLTTLSSWTFSSHSVRAFSNIN